MRIYEAAILLIQLAAFYLYPLVATNPMGMVITLLLATLVLAVVWGAVARCRWRLLYPVAVAAAFVPSVFIYYNESALVHALWYLGVAAIGMMIGMLVRKAFKKR